MSCLTLNSVDLNRKHSYHYPYTHHTMIQFTLIKRLRSLPAVPSALHDASLTVYCCFHFILADKKKNNEHGVKNADAFSNHISKSSMANCIHVAKHMWL